MLLISWFKGSNRLGCYRDKSKKGGESSGGRKKGSGNCFKCGEMKYKSFECPKKEDKCFKCARLGHKADVCQEKAICFNFGEEGHKSLVCKKPKNTAG
ncbi:zinc finger protein GIS2, partial [Trifolium medium]|nr:zinc finger protein GIS2 [Trifolium medium]